MVNTSILCMCHYHLS